MYGANPPGLLLLRVLDGLKKAAPYFSSFLWPTPFTVSNYSA